MVEDALELIAMRDIVSMFHFALLQRLYSGPHGAAGLHALARAATQVHEVEQENALRQFVWVQENKWKSVTTELVQNRLVMILTGKRGDNGAPAHDLATLAISSEGDNAVPINVWDFILPSEAATIRAAHKLL